MEMISATQSDAEEAEGAEAAQRTQRLQLGRLLLFWKPADHSLDSLLH